MITSVLGDLSIRDLFEPMSCMYVNNILYMYPYNYISVNSSMEFEWKILSPRNETQDSKVTLLREPMIDALTRSCNTIPLSGLVGFPSARIWKRTLLVSIEWMTRNNLYPSQLMARKEWKGAYDDRRFAYEACKKAKSSWVFWTITEWNHRTESFSIMIMLRMDKTKMNEMECPFLCTIWPYRKSQYNTKHLEAEVGKSILKKNIWSWWAYHHGKR